MKYRMISSAALTVLSLTAISAAEPSSHILWTNTPVPIDNVDEPKMPTLQGTWERHVYPIGNGRMGATLFGKTDRERIQFNEDSLWVGNEDNTGGYQPFGDVYVEMPHAEFTDYRRELDIERAVQTITYKSGGVTYKRECFASYPAQVMVFRFTADKPGALTGKVSMGNVHEVPITTESDTLVMKGDTSKFWFWQLHVDQPKRLLASREYASPKNIDLDIEARVRVLHDGGSIKAEDSFITFENCNTLTLVMSADTNYVNERDKGWTGEHPHKRVAAWVDTAAVRSYDELLTEHIADYQKLYGRMAIDLGQTPEEITKLSTLERVNRYSEQIKIEKSAVDRDLEELLYQYARYLMIACSRPGEGGMPANLQGLWSINKRPAWRCDYHTDINVQMNYWFTGPSNLNECFTPLAEWIESIREVRKEETQKVLGVKRGWLMRSENGVFGGSTWHFQKGDSAWLCQNLWDHYQFTQDEEFLKTYAYPVMKEISEFWVDHLKELPDGTLVAPDGRSPEHGPEKSDGVTYDQMLCWDLFTNMIEASKVLGVDQEYAEQLKAKRAKLLGPKIGRWGQLQEWMEDIDDPNDDHRHVNHMIGIYPGRQIHPSITPDLAEAAKVGLKARGNGKTGWSKAWKISLYARLLDSENAYHLLSDLMATKMYGNLWTTHPPFQIDCNFGYAAGVNDMLAQSHMGYIHLLPALPKQWATGSVNGLRVRGGHELDMTWKDGKLLTATLRNVTGGDAKCSLHYADSKLEIDLKQGESRTVKLNEFTK